MEKSNNRVLNELLVNLFHNVMDAEAKAVITDEFKDITNNDMHILEAIGIEEPKSMSRIAGELHVTVGTLTTNMNLSLIHISRCCAWTAVWRCKTMSGNK